MVIEGAQLPVPVGLSGMNDGVSRAAILAATAYKRIPLMCTRDR
jgi:hypothetical protein